MAFTGRLTVLAAIALACTLFGFTAGARAGFNEGYHVANHSSDIITAGLLLTSLQANDKGECSEARGMLEILVDRALVMEWAHQLRPQGRPFHAPLEPYQIDLAPILRSLANYRQAHPREVPEPGNAAIRSVLARYSNHARK